MEKNWRSLIMDDLNFLQKKMILKNQDRIIFEIRKQKNSTVGLLTGVSSAKY